MASIPIGEVAFFTLYPLSSSPVIAATFTLKVEVGKEMRICYDKDNLGEWEEALPWIIIEPRSGILKSWQNI